MRTLSSLFALSVLSLQACVSWAQDFPVKPIRVVVPFAPGGGTDMIARTLAQKMQETWGQSVVVENRAGGTGAIGAAIVAKAPPDGHTLLVVTSSTHAIWPSIKTDLPYHPERDFAARVMSQELAGPLGQPVIVENRGAGVYSGEIVSKATPDGHTLLVTGTSFWVGPLFRKTPYDPVRDFSPISLLVNSPNVLVVHPGLPVKTVKELVDLAKVKPGQLNYATASTGSSSHLASELFKSMAGIDALRIPYKGTGPGLIDLMSGRVHFSFATSSGAEPHVKAGPRDAKSL